MPESFILVAALLKLGFAIFSVIAVMTSLKWFDRAANHKFKETFQEMDHGAKAVYLGFRFVGVCLLVGLVVSS